MCGISYLAVGAVEDDGIGLCTVVSRDHFLEPTMQFCG